MQMSFNSWEQALDLWTWCDCGCTLMHCTVFWRCMPLNFMQCFQHVFHLFLTAWWVSALSWSYFLFSRGHPSSAPSSVSAARQGEKRGADHKTEKERLRGLLRPQLQPLSAPTPSSIRTGSLTRYDWWSQPRPRPRFGERLGCESVLVSVGVTDGGKGDEPGDMIGGFSLEGTECWPWGEEDTKSEGGGVEESR